MTETTGRPPLELVEESPDADLPRTFGNYLLLSRLGQGGMGDVYLAKHGGIAGIEKHCVLKTLRPQFTDDREYVSRFIDEARVVVQLSHKNWPTKVNWWSRSTANRGIRNRATSPSFGPAPNRKKT